MGNVQTYGSSMRGAGWSGAPQPAGRFRGRGVGCRRGGCPGVRGAGRSGLIGLGDVHTGPGADTGPECCDDRHHLEVGHGRQRLHHHGPGSGPLRGRADRREGLLRHDQRPGRRERPQVARRLQGRRLQRPAESDRDPGGNQQRLRARRQLLPLRRVRMRRPGQQHRRAGRVGDARRRDQRAAQRLQRPAAVRSAGPWPDRVLQAALPQGQERRRHRLRCGLGQDADGPAVRGPQARGLHDRLRRRRQPACSRTSRPTSST